MKKEKKFYYETFNTLDNKPRSYTLSNVTEKEKDIFNASSSNSFIYTNKKFLSNKNIFDENNEESKRFSKLIKEKASKKKNF